MTKKNKDTSKKEELDSKKLSVILLDYLVFICSVFLEPIKKTWRWKDEFGEKYPELRKHALIGSILVLTLLIWTLWSGVVANIHTIAYLLTPKEVILEDKNKSEIMEFLKEHERLIDMKDCGEVAKYETSYVNAELDRKNTWINDCERNVGKVLSYDSVVYRFDKNDGGENVEVLVFELVDERDGEVIVKNIYERRFYLRRSESGPFGWLITGSTKSKIKIEKRIFEDPK